MAMKIIEVKKESCPAARLIGKKYTGNVNWNEWWEQNLFATLEAMETHNKCLDALAGNGFKRKEDDWCFERYNCPRYTTPDEKGNVILDYVIAIHGRVG